MSQPPIPHVAEAVLHYLAPIVPAIYYLAAKVTATCLLQKPSRGAGLNWRRYLAIGLALTATTTVVAEGVSAIVRCIIQPEIKMPEDYVLYLALLFAVHTSFVLGLLENRHPIWHPYLGGWLLAFVMEVPIIVQEAVVASPRDGFTTGAFALQCLRAFALLVLSVASGCFVLQDRSKSVRLDDETEALFANGDATGQDGTNGQTAKASRRSSTSAGDNSGSQEDDEDDEDEDALGFDSDSEEPEEDKKFRKQQRQRLRASGNWLNYMMEYKIFIPMLWPSKDRFIQACLAVIGLSILGERVLNILTPRQLGIITDELTQGAGNGVVPWKSIGLWMLYAALGSGAGIHMIKSIAEIPVEQYTHKALATTAFSHIMSLSMDFHSNKNSGELIRAIEQGSNLQDLLKFMFFEVAPVFFDLIAAFFYVYSLFDIYMAMILGAVGASYMWVGTRLATWNIEQRRKWNSAWRLESKVQNEAISNWQTVSHFNRSKHESDRYGEVMDDLTMAEWNYWLMYNLGSGLQAFIMMVGRLCATLLAVYRVSQGHARIGNLIALTAYWSSIETPLAIVSYSVRRITQMLTDSERLLQLLQTKASIADAANASELVISRGEVTFDKVNFAYDARRPVLQNVSFTVQPGQTVALVGETGGGKSTILKLLYRYYDVDSGAIRIDGQDVRAVTQDSLREPFGMVPQDPSLFNVSLMENLRYARLDASDEEVHEACRAAAIHDKIVSFPDGYASLVGERGVKLSGGEMQRVAIARAILRQPSIVLLDEATSMVDAETEALIQTAFRRLTRQRTTFIVAHRLSTIQHADLILVIGNGGIVERGTHAELLKANGKYVKLWSKQLSKEMPSETVRDLIQLDEARAESADEAAGDNE